jgi:hypothetical protein
MEVRSVEAIVRALNDAAVRYIVVGGLAVNAHGYERLTRDVDIVIGLEHDNILMGVRALLSIGYSPSIPVSAEEFANSANREMWRREKNMLVLKLWSDIHRRTPVDVFVYEPFDFEAEYVLAERMEIASGLSAPFATWESLLAMKRSAGRPQDLADIAALEEIRRIREDEGDE